MKKEKNNKVAIICYLVVALVGILLAVKVGMDYKSKSDFISKAKDIYRLAVQNKTDGIQYIDSKEKKLSDSDLNYHIEFNYNGNILYFLVYDDKHIIEIEEIRVEESDFDSTKNYVKNPTKELESFAYKHESMYSKYANTVSKYNTSLAEVTPDNPQEETQQPTTTTPTNPTTTTPTNPSTTTPTTPDEKPSTGDTKETKYKVSFNQNGGSGGQTSTLEVKYNGSMPSISKTKPTRSGYKFLGYYDNSDYTKGKAYYNASCEAVRNYDKKGNITLYAGWGVESTTPTNTTEPTNPTTTTPTNPSTTTPTNPTPTTPTTPTTTTTTTTQDKITYTISKNKNCGTQMNKGYTDKLESDGTYSYTLHMGRVPNGCYSIDITNVYIDNNDNVIIYAENKYPEANMMCTQAIAYPCATVTFSRKPNSIEVIETDKYSTQTQTTPSTETETLTYTVSKKGSCSSMLSAGYAENQTSDGYVVEVNLGRKSHGGYSVDISNVNITFGDRVKIYATSENPDPSLSYTQAIEYPCVKVTFSGAPSELKVYLNDNELSKDGAGGLKGKGHKE